MSAASDYMEQALINHIFRGIPFAVPTSLYFALFSNSPEDDGSGTEISGNGYARVQVVCNTTNWMAPTWEGYTTNNVQIQFPIATASWGMINYLAIFDAASGGNMLYQGGLFLTPTINTGDRFTFPVGYFSLMIDEFGGGE